MNKQFFIFTDELYSRLKVCNADHAVYHESIAEKMEEAMRRTGKTFTKILIGQKTPSMAAKGIVTFEEILADESIQSVPPVEVRNNSAKKNRLRYCMKVIACIC